MCTYRGCCVVLLLLLPPPLLPAAGVPGADLGTNAAAAADILPAEGGAFCSLLSLSF
jgi:hypothetical protein